MHSTTFGMFHCNNNDVYEQSIHIITIVIHSNVCFYMSHFYPTGMKMWWGKNGTPLLWSLIYLIALYNRWKNKFISSIERFYPCLLKSAYFKVMFWYSNISLFNGIFATVELENCFAHILLPLCVFDLKFLEVNVSDVMYQSNVVLYNLLLLFVYFLGCPIFTPYFLVSRFYPIWLYCFTEYVKIRKI